MANRPGNANNGNNANNANANNNSMNEHVEFTVRSEEDLYLTGSENTLRRVAADTNYSCLMLKTQRFSSLFRHYAKYHGLRKDDLEYYFVNPLEHEETPESVHLQRGDIITVRKKKKIEIPEAAADDDEFFKDMKDLLDDEEHMDAVFLVHPIGHSSHGHAGAATSAATSTTTSSLMATTKTMPNTTELHKKRKIPPDLIENLLSSTRDIVPSSNLVEIRAHKCILAARADYFKALFRKSAGEYSTNSINSNNNSNCSSNSGSHRITAFREANECVVRVEPCFSPKIVRLMLEFLYTNRIECLKVSAESSSRIGSTSQPSCTPTVTADDLLSLLHLSDMWQLRDLKRLVEHELIRSHTTIDTVARMYCATEDFGAKRLAKSCLEFIMENYREVTGNLAFQEEMKHYPHLCIPVLKAAADLIPEHPVHKKQRLSAAEMKGGGPVEGASGDLTRGMASSPVIDSDH